MTRILIVDDKEENLYYLRALLEGHSFTVESAQNGADALILAHRSPPDVIISDLLMPIMDGYRLLRQWKTDANLKLIPFIVYSATYTDLEDEHLALEFGADAFIRKPTDPEDFLARLREVLARGRETMRPSPHEALSDETSVLRHYSEVLVRKLEQKMIEIEEANRALQRELAERRAIEDEITFKNRVLKTQQETSLDAILVVDKGGRILSFNQQFVDLWEIPENLLDAGIDAPLLKVAAEKVENPEDFVSRVNHLYEHLEYRSRDELRLKDGRIIDRYSAPITGENGWYYGRIWYFRDITERREAEIRIAYLNRVYALLSAINTLILRVKDREELFRETCRIAVDEGGFRMALIVMFDKETREIISSASAGMDDELKQSTHAILSSGKMDQILIFQALRRKEPLVSNDSLKDPRVIFGKKYADIDVRSLVVLPLIVSGDAQGALTLFAKETEFFHKDEMNLLVELSADIAFAIDYLDKQERLNYLAYYDVLTGLPNRNLFLMRVDEHLQSARDHGQSVALFLIDLEHFKNINDSFGRPSGDTLLNQVAAWLRTKMGGDHLLARVDGDHFALILPALSPSADISGEIEKILTGLLEHPFRLNDAEFRIGAKGGVALFPADGADAETMFKNVEAALKMAKKGGDRYLFHTKKMTESVAGKLSLENQLRQAIEKQEFVLFYQPKISMKSEKVSGAEALIRWNNPQKGLMSPSQFIPILEETSLIYDVGRWAIRQAIDDFLRWGRLGLKAVRIGVNVSPLQLRNPGFVAEISRMSRINPQAAKALEIEITEGMIMEDLKQSTAKLKSIQEMGISVAIDDFGTGFSSLGYLSKLPIDTLKIDRSFVVNMTESPEGLALVSTIINLAHSLKLNVVAEGVETEVQRELLLSLTCDEIQGFLVSPPVPADLFEKNFLTTPT